MQPTQPRQTETKLFTYMHFTINVRIQQVTNIPWACHNTIYAETNIDVLPSKMYASSYNADVRK